MIFCSKWVDICILMVVPFLNESLHLLITKFDCGEIRLNIAWMFI